MSNFDKAIMTKEEKLSVYGNHLEIFENEKIKSIVESVIENTPTIFFGASTSSTGKYHPLATNGLMGLVKHNIAVMLTAKDFYRNETVMEVFQLDNLTDLEKEVILAACLLHDNAKYGCVETLDETNIEFKKVHTRNDHPAIIENLFVNIKGEDDETDKLIVEINSIISTHMGQWTHIDKERSLNRPETNKQKFVHMCDYVASRKTLDIVSELTMPTSIGKETLHYFNEIS